MGWLDADASSSSEPAPKNQFIMVKGGSKFKKVSHISLSWRTSPHKGTRQYKQHRASRRAAVNLKRPTTPRCADPHRILPLSSLLFRIVYMMLLALQFGMQPILTQQFISGDVVKTSLVLSIEVSTVDISFQNIYVCIHVAIVSHRCCCLETPVDVLRPRNEMCHREPGAASCEPGAGSRKSCSKDAFTDVLRLPSSSPPRQVTC